MLSETGEVEGLWMPTIRTHAYVIYVTQEQAEATFTATLDVEWPKGNRGRSSSTSPMLMHPALCFTCALRELMRLTL